MTTEHDARASGIELPRPLIWQQKTQIDAPDYTTFTARFGNVLPQPHYLQGSLGRTAVYDLPPPSGRAELNVLLIHGLNTPALGMLPLARHLQSLRPETHVVLYDLWGHGLSSTPLVAHTQHIFHLQILQVLGHLKWSSAHIAGFSFGGPTIVTFALDYPWAVSSAILLGPAGMLHRGMLSEKMQQLLADSSGRDGEAIDEVFLWLEGGPLKVPDNAAERMKEGEIVAEALRLWELEEHRGYPHSVLSMFRDGPVWAREAQFRKFAALPMPKMGIVGGADDICSKAQLVDVGIDHVEIIPQADHGFVRSDSHEVAKIIAQFLK